MTTLVWIILSVVWLISVITVYWIDIVSYKEDNRPYTVGRAIVDLLVGSCGCGLLLIMMRWTEKILIIIGLIFLYISELVSPILNKRIL